MSYNNTKTPIKPTDEATAVRHGLNEKTVMSITYLQTWMVQ